MDIPDTWSLSVLWSSVLSLPELVFKKVYTSLLDGMALLQKQRLGNLSSICHEILMASCLTLSTVGHGSSGVLVSLTLGHHFLYASRTHPSRKITPSPWAFARVLNLIVQESSQISELPCPALWFALWFVLTVQPRVFFQLHQHILAMSCSSSGVGVK